MSSDEPLAPGVWHRNGGWLLVRHGSTLPAICVDCGSVCSGPPVVERYKELKSTSAARLVKRGARGPFIALFGNKAEVGTYLCDGDVARRRRNRIISLLFVLALPVLTFAFPAVMDASKWACAAIAVVWVLAWSVFRSAGKRLTVFAVEEDGLAFFDSTSSKFFDAARAMRDGRLGQGV